MTSNVLIAGISVEFILDPFQAGESELGPGNVMVVDEGRGGVSWLWGDFMLCDLSKIFILFSVNGRGVQHDLSRRTIR